MEWYIVWFKYKGQVDILSGLNTRDKLIYLLLLIL